MDADTLIAALPILDAGELGRVRAVVEAMSRRAGDSTVLERRNYRNGLLQLEVRTYTRKEAPRSGVAPTDITIIGSTVGRSHSTSVRRGIQSTYWIANSPRFYFRKMVLCS